LPRSSNIIIFLVDKLRPDHLGIYGYRKRTSPNIDRLARQAIVFEHAYAPCPWTYPSVVSLLTGLIPSVHGAVLKKKSVSIANPDIWLPRVFQSHGFATVCFHTHPFLRKSFSNIHAGFEGYYDPSEKMRGQDRFSKFMYLDTLYPACERWLEENHRRKFFMYIHVIDVHGPYSEMRVVDEDEERLRALHKENTVLPRTDNGMLASSTSTANPHKALFYDGHIFFVDGYFNKLLNKLDSLGISDNTLLILTSDHGEGFGEHNCWNHGRNVYEHQIRIPLAFFAHRAVKLRAGRINGIVNSIGLMPSLFDMLGMPFNENINGRSFAHLLGTGDHEWRYDCLSEGCVEHEKVDPDAFMVDHRLKLITDKISGAQCLFDLAEDPHEMHPISAKGRGVSSLRDALNILARKREAFMELARRKKSSSNNLRRQDLEDIKTLGYL